jgi:DNA-binding NtrC family response regulator
MSASGPPPLAESTLAPTTGTDRALRQVSILVVDDEPGMRAFLLRLLGPHCRRVEAAASAEEATQLLDARHFDVVVLDNVMPGQSGLDWLAEQRRVGFLVEAILITAYADLDTAIQALRVGAADFVPKPFRANQILAAVARCLNRHHPGRDGTLGTRPRSDRLAARGRLIGRSPRIEAVRRTLERAASLPTPVLLTGESGTGKEIAARTLHAMSHRSDKPFVAVGCAALTPERMATELFGEPGGEGRRGLLFHASGGTLFLDEISELPGSGQATLLRVIEDNRARPAGSEREVPLDLRFVCATNTDLDAAVAAGRFRRDLFHRINVLRVDMPPLRERVGDIADLVELFVGGFARQMGVPPLPAGEALVRCLARHDWPGNVRELRNLVERSTILGGFPPEFSGEDRAAGTEPADSLHAVERQHILAVLSACGGNRAQAARRLGVSRKTIDRKCAMWNV